MDPCTILGIPHDADLETARAAYLARLREHPPERGGGQFERIRDAWAVLSDPRRRAAALLEADPEAPFVSLVRVDPSKRHFVGPKPWLDAMREKRP